MKIGVIINPHAGGNGHGSDRGRALARIVEGEGTVFEPATLAELQSVAADLCERQTEILAICGGDGSFFRTLSAMMEASRGMPLPLFLPLRAGSMNTIARGLGCPRLSPERSLARTVERCRRGEPLDVIERGLIRVNGVHYGFMTGAGTVVGFLRAYYDGPRKGPIGATHLVGRLAYSAAFGTALVPEVFRWVTARTVCSKEVVPFEEFSVIYGSNVADIGVGFRPAYRAGERNDRFHFLAGPVDAQEFLRRLWRIYRGRPTGSPLMYDALTDRVEIEFQRPEPYMVDGDILEPVPRLVMEAGPVLRIVRGLHPLSRSHHFSERERGQGERRRRTT